MKLTYEMIMAGQSDEGGWNSGQLKLFGIKFHQLKRGWIGRLIGMEVSEGDYEKFLALKGMTKDKLRYERGIDTKKSKKVLRAAPREFCREICRLLDELDWIAGYNLHGQDHEKLEKAQKLAREFLEMF